MDKKKLALQIGSLRMITPIIVMSILALLDITGTARVILLSICIIPYVVCPPEEELITLFFFVGFASSIDVSFAGVPYITVLQLILVGKVLLRSGIKKGYLIFLMAVIFLQMYAVTTCGLSVIKLVTFILNLLLLYSIGYGLDIDKRNLHSCYIAFAIGIAIVLLASIRMEPLFFSGTYYRFKGIWTDQNFLAMFCGLSCLLLYYSWIKERKHLLLSAVLLVFYVYCGYRTYSMTFLFCLALLIGLLLADLLSSNASLVFKTIAILALVVIGMYVFLNVYTGVVEGRGRAVYEVGTDWTHGRFRDTGMVFDAWKQSIGNGLFGFGINNSPSYVQVAAHNTYVEILAQLGVLIAGSIVVGVVSFCVRYRVGIKRIITQKVSYVLILIFYMFTLSMESTDVLYLLLGVAVNVLVHDESFSDLTTDFVN